MSFIEHQLLASCFHRCKNVLTRSFTYFFSSVFTDLFSGLADLQVTPLQLNRSLSFGPLHGNINNYSFEKWAEWCLASEHRCWARKRSFWSWHPLDWEPGSSQRRCILLCSLSQQWGSFIQHVSERGSERGGAYALGGQELIYFLHCWYSQSLAHRELIKNDGTNECCWLTDKKTKDPRTQVPSEGHLVGKKWK